VNRPLKIPTGFRPPAQGWNNPGHRVVMHPQPQRGYIIIIPPHGHNPAGVDDNQSRGPRVARASQPWALCRNPVGLAPMKIPTGFHSPAQGWNNPGYRVAMKPQPQGGCTIIEPPHGHNPGGVDENQSRGPRVARASQPWALFCNPVGIERTTIPMRLPPPAQGGNYSGYRNSAWALFHNPAGIGQMKIPTEFRPPAQGSGNAATLGKPSNKPTTPTGLRQPI